MPLTIEDLVAIENHLLPKMEERLLPKIEERLLPKMESRIISKMEDIFITRREFIQVTEGIFSTLQGHIRQSMSDHDKIFKKLDAIQQDNLSAKAQYDRHDYKLDDHERRLTSIESHI